LIGSALASSLKLQGQEVTQLVRRPSHNSAELQWDPMQQVPPQLVSGFDAVIHLSGENVAGRWTEAKKGRVRDSRVVSTQNLTQALARTERPAKTFICASAIGYYGSRGDEILTEESPSGNGFLAEVCRQWEAAAEPASRAGIRTVNLRTGIVLSKDGGALKQILLPFRLGLGGRVGSGRQWWSWIHIADLISAIHHILQSTPGTKSPPSPQLLGPVNMVAPTPVINAEFTRTLAAVLKRPAILPVPVFAARLAFGEFADEGLLASARVEPGKLMKSRFNFEHPDLRSAFKTLV
jgi:uncharacterized protein